MKKAILVLFLALVSGWVSAQRRLYLSEGFQGGPYYIHDDLWDISASDLDGVLYYSKTQMAGGAEAWEGLLGYYPDMGLATQLDGTYRFVFKKVSTMVASNYVSVKYFYESDKNSVEGARIFGLAARIAGGDWTVIRQISQMPKDLGQGMLVGLLPDNMRGAKDVQVCVFYTTPKDNAKYLLYIDDIEFFAYLDNTYAANFGWKGQPFTGNGALAVGLAIENAGNKMESCEISYTLNGGAVQTMPLTFADGLFPGEVYVKDNFVPEGWDATAYGKHTLEFWLSKVNGTDVAEDKIQKQVKYLTNIDPATPRYQFRPLVEHFSASTCGPCANLNRLMNPIYESLGDTISMIKYQVDFPGNGDPYATDESIDRRVYYNVGGVPSIVLNGNMLAVSGTYDEIAAHLRSLMLAATKKKVYYGMWFDTLAVDADQNIRISLKVKAIGGAENVVLHTVVEEGVTYGNASTNGETEFHNVMMKMLPDANGRVVTLLPDTVYTFDYVYDMTQTHMEEFTDLKVACFLQTESGDVLQSVIGSAGSYNVEAGAVLRMDYVPAYICAEDVPVGLRLIGTGGTPVTSVEIEGKVGAAGTPVTRTYPVSMVWGENAYVAFDGLKATATGTDTVYFTITKINDAAFDGQAVRRAIYVQPTEYTFLPLLEDFTSASNDGSAVLNPYVDAFDGVCIVKIPMKGDRYTRTAFTSYAAKMGVSSAPGLALNGYVVDVEADGKLVEEDYFESLLEQVRNNRSIMTVSVTDDVTIKGSAINPTVSTILNFASPVDVSGLLYAFVVETETVGNAGINGEKPIKRVVQALLPDENGIAVHVRNGSLRYPLIRSILSPQVENFDNLKLVVIVKDAATNGVLQTAEFPIKNENVPNESVATYETLAVYPNPASESVYLKGLDNATLDVFDLTGVKVFGLSGVSGDYTLDVRGYVPGAYIIKVREGAKVSTARISVVR